MAVENDYNRMAADFENWRRQQEAQKQAELEQQRIIQEQQRAAEVAAQQQAQRMAAEEQIRQAQQTQQMQAQQIMNQQQNAQPIPTLQPTQPTLNYAEQAKAIGLPWSPDDADYIQQINDYNARVNGLKQSAAERQATTEALRQQIATNPALLEQGKQNLANDKQLNTLADQLNAFYAKQNNAVQDEAQRAYTTAVLRTQIAQNPELFANAVKQFAPKKSGKKASKKAVTNNSGEPYVPPYVTDEYELSPEDIRAIGDLKRYEYQEAKKKN